MRVKLLKDIIQNGTLKASVRNGRKSVPFVEGNVVEVSEATGQKWIDAGLAEQYDDLDDQFDTQLSDTVRVQKEDE